MHVARAHSLADRRVAVALALALTLTVSGCSSPTPSPGVDLGRTATPRETAASTATPARPRVEPTPGPTPTPAASVDPGAAYLALGDSVTFGIGVPDPRRNGFVARVASALATATPPIGETRVFAVPGETASGFRDRRLDDVLGAIDELGPRVGLVTIGLGANELLRTRREPACADRASDPCRAIVTTAVAAATGALETIVREVRAALEATGSSARILLLAYYNPEIGEPMASSVSGSDGVVGCDPAEAVPGLDDRIACIAETNGVELVDLYAPFLGREAELTRITDGDVHPNDAGYGVIADTILGVVAGGS